MEAASAADPFGSPPARRVRTAGEGVEVPNVGRPVFWILIAIGAFAALGLGGLMATDWSTIQLFLHRAPFGQTDPTFGLDISFFLFELPFFRLLQTYGNSLLLLAVVLSGVRYLVAVVSGASMPTSARVHLGLLALAYLWSIAIGYQLDRYELVYSTHERHLPGRQLHGRERPDAGHQRDDRHRPLHRRHGRVPRLRQIGDAAGARRWSPGWAPTSSSKSAIRSRSSGSRSCRTSRPRSRPTSPDNIDMTRLAFNLDGWSVLELLSLRRRSPKQAVAAEPGTIQNVRLWDADPLQKTLDQVQIIRSYYTFTSVNTDRYTFTDPASCSPNPAPCVRQVMLAGRELDPTKLGSRAGSTSTSPTPTASAWRWSRSTTPARQGQPNLLIQDLPPTSDPGTPTIKQGRIYFGRQESNYVIVDAASQEFDYPASGGRQDLQLDRHRRDQARHAADRGCCTRPSSAT